MAGDKTNGMDVGRQELERDLFWKVPLPPECIHFVDSPDSENFSRLLLAFEQASIIAMDAEWKPIFDKDDGASRPRVSILQIACRLQGYKRIRKERRENLGHSKEIPSIRAEDKKSGLKKCQGAPSTSQLGKMSNWDGEEGKSVESFSPLSAHAVANVQESTLQTFKSPVAQRDLSCLTTSQHETKDGTQVIAVSVQERVGEGDKGRKKENRCEISEKEQTGTGKPTKAGYEMIFLLDLLALPLSALSEMLKEVFVDPMVLKLGFGFKQDLIHLRGTFPGHVCFDKVEPYLDVRKLYRNVHESKTSYTHRGKRMVIGGDSLASISETVLGLPQRKDMQCSNWELRPLTAAQFDYAAADAYCLLAIFDALRTKISASWVSPVVAGDDQDALWSGSKVGVAGLLSPENGVSLGNGHKPVFISICQPKRGNAAVMVEAALGGAACSGLRRDSKDLNSLSASNTLGIEALVRIFGEKLLISGGQNVKSKRVRRKSRSRRAREGGMSRELPNEQDFEYVGPPPWDSALGGDGIPRFLCDAMVEGLARQLRCVGIDAASPNSKKCEPRELVNLAEKEGRVILTRDVKLLRSRLLPEDLAYRVKRQGKWDQLAEIIEAFKLLIREDQLLTRCTKCNGEFIQKALSAKEAVAQGPWSQVIPDCVLKNVDEFWQCSTCKHLYWQGFQFTRAYEQFVAVCLTEKQ